MRDYNKKNLTFEERNTRTTNPSREEILVMSSISISTQREGEPITIVGDPRKGVECSPPSVAGKCPHMSGQRHRDVYVPFCGPAQSPCSVGSQLRIWGVSRRVLFSS